MENFNSYSQFLQSSYKDWVPSYEDSHDVPATQELLDSPCTFFAYTDYGGEFLDRVGAAFMEAHAPTDRVLSQSTCSFGCNLLYIGAPQSGTYPLSDFPDISKDFEEFYCQMENEATEESFKFFLDDLFEQRKRLKKWGLDVLMEHQSGYYSPQPDGTIDFCFSDLSKWLLSQTRH